jgi:hypothetical protein
LPLIRLLTISQLYTLYTLDFFDALCFYRCFCAVPYKGKLYVFGGESEKVNKKMKMRGKRELNRSVLWLVILIINTYYLECFDKNM